MDLLNPKLYHSLRGRFGEVKVSNEGQRMLVKTIRDPLTRKFKDLILEPGENYRVCCPYCGDTRFRLYVSYRWNTVDLEGKPFGSHLAHCFNEECNMRNFRDELQTYLVGNTVIDRSCTEQVNTLVSFQPVALPGLCTPVHLLPENHAARMYLLGRGFDPVELGLQWCVYYCHSCAEDEYGFIPGTKSLARLVRNRIIFPIHRLGVMVGYQARAIEPHPIKYYTMPGLHKAHLIYNGDRAKEYDFGVIVEGVLDAIRVGPQAGALLGKSLSWRQRELVLAYWGSGSVCIMLDPDAIEEMERMQRLLNSQAFRWGSFCLHLPPGTDPGSTDREQLWGLIASYARARNIRLTSG